MSDDYEKARANHDFLGMAKARKAEEKAARLYYEYLASAGITPQEIAALKQLAKLLREEIKNDNENL